MFFSGRKAIICSILGFSLCMIIVIFRYEPLSSIAGVLSSSEGKEKCEADHSTSDEFWNNVDYEKFMIPEEVMEKLSKISVQRKTVSIDGTKVVYRTGSGNVDGALSVLLLHGRIFSSKEWAEIRTIQFCTALGFRAIAVDLPGFGKTPDMDGDSKNSFMSNIIAALNLEKLVIISPSMSGVYAVPYLTQNWRNISGFVPISPVGADLLFHYDCHGNNLEISTNDYYCSLWMKQLHGSAIPDVSCLKVPTMVVCGQYDNKMNSARMCHLPLSTGVLISDAKHSAYMENPGLWHLVLYNFLKRVNHQEICSA